MVKKVGSKVEWKEQEGQVGIKFIPHRIMTHFRFVQDDGSINETINNSSERRNVQKEVLMTKLNDDLYKIISANPGVKSPMLVSLVGRPRSAILRSLAMLKRVGLVEYRGSKKIGGYFSVADL